MIFTKETKCPICNGELKHYDRVKRITKGIYGTKEFIFIERHKCLGCGKIHRELPTILYPYKHYLKEIIDGFIEEQLSIFDLEFEDFPNELTIQRWKNSRVDF